MKTPLPDLAPVPRKLYPYVVTKQTKVLVTGATGFLGTRLVQRLAAEGYPVRALARKLPTVGALKKLGGEIVFGDMGEESPIAAAMKGVDVVVPAAAETGGTEKDSGTGPVAGTRTP